LVLSLQTIPLGPTSVSYLAELTPSPSPPPPSNGIRFTISDLSPPTSRILPTVSSYRANISLYDAQYDHNGNQIPIPEYIIQDVIAALLRYQIVCTDFGVPENHIHVLATEATRTAINFAEFLRAIYASTGLTVEVLAKEDEGKVGALGIASSFSDVRGLVMDLGGGSTQITWMVVRQGRVQTSPKGAFSFPYGAAALTRKLREIDAGKSKDEARKARDKLREEMKANFLNAYDQLEIPKDMVEEAKSESGFPLYLSGGGFRGWGYLLLFQNQVHGHHYPFSIINGFMSHKENFEDTEALKGVAKTAHRIFRVSDRRRTQVPAVAFLVNVLAEALPHGIKEARFCQGGVREGVLFQELTTFVRAQDPLEIATAPFARPSAGEIAEHLLKSIPPSLRTDPRRFPESITLHVIRAFANVLYVHSDMSKESSSASALYSTSTGILASSHGLSHIDRALLCLMLEERYEGELPPREVDFKDSLRLLLAPEQVWWTRYIGKVGLLVSRLYPAGVIKREEPRIRLSAAWATNLGKKKRKEGLELTVSIQRRENDPFKFKESLEAHVGKIAKVGKKKHWIGGEEGWGMTVRVVVKEEDWIELEPEGWEKLDVSTTGFSAT
jgi:retrograde regulation protein 2